MEFYEASAIWDKKMLGRKGTAEILIFKSVQFKH